MAKKVTSVMEKMNVLVSVYSRAVRGRTPPPPPPKISDSSCKVVSDYYTILWLSLFLKRHTKNTLRFNLRVVKYVKSSQVKNYRHNFKTLSDSVSDQLIFKNLLRYIYN